MALLSMTATLLFAALMSKLIIDATWNLFISPLSAIPGPKLAAISRLPLLRQKASGYAERWIMELHRTHGDVVRVAPNEVSFANDVAWKRIYGYAPGSQFAVLGKDPAMYGVHRGEYAVISAGDVDHSRQRKAFSPAFSEKAVRAQESLIKGYIKQLLQNIGSGQPIDLARQYNFTTFDIMGDLAFGQPLGCLETGEYNSWISLIFASLKFMTIISEVKRYPLVERLLDRMIPASLREKEKQHYQFSADRVDKRLSQQDAKPDIWRFVLAAEEKDIRLTRGEMHTNAGLFMIAGTETTATLLSSLTYYLLANPEKMKHVTQEIRGRFDSADKISAQEVLSLKYLTACANEAFRMHPPVPIGLPRLVPKGGIEICDYELPEGTSIYIHQLSTGRNPNNFVDPDLFLPERWLSTNSETKLNTSAKLTSPSMEDMRFANDKKSCVQPFSIGPRNCLGQNLAWLEFRLIMVNVLWHFDLELCKGSEYWDEQQVFNLWVSKPLMVTAKPVSR